MGDLSSSSGRTVLVIGIGNAYRSDDGAGPVAAQRLRSKKSKSFRVLVHNGDGAELMDSWKGVDTVILLDAVQSGAEAGTLYRWDASSQPLPAHPFRGSTHAFSLPQAIELARALHQLPRRVIVYGVEGRSYVSGTVLSPKLEGALARLIERVLEEVQRSERAGTDESLSRGR